MRQHLMPFLLLSCYLGTVRCGVLRAMVDISSTVELTRLDTCLVRVWPLHEGHITCSGVVSLA